MSHNDAPAIGKRMTHQINVFIFRYTRCQPDPYDALRVIYR